MRTTRLQNALRAAAGGMLALAAVAGALEQLQAGTHAASQVSQFCAPPQEEDSEAPKFYCGHDYS
jgi:hypothetical protein